MRASLTTCALVMMSPPSMTNPLPALGRVGALVHGEYQSAFCEWLAIRTTERSICASPRSDERFPARSDERFPAQAKPANPQSKATPRRGRPGQ